VYDGRPLFPMVQAAPVAGAALNARLRQLLLAHATIVTGGDQPTPLGPDAEGVHCAHAWVSSRRHATGLIRAGAGPSVAEP
jgi:hypothetical protein